jgi:hypothetical protein
LRMLADAPLADTRQDFFGFTAYADALARLIDSEGTDTPLTLAISGRWGSGKTSLARMVERRLAQSTAQRSGERPIITCWFDAWMHNDAEHLGAAMAGSVARVAGANRPIWRRILEPLPPSMLTVRERWRRRLTMLLSATTLSVIALLIPGVREALGVGLDEKLLTGGSLIVILLLFVEAIKIVRPALDQAAHFFEDPASEAARGTVQEARNQLGRLIEHATQKGSIVVFVDNLERCSPARAIQVCEAANQLLSHKGVVAILIADMEVIEGFAGSLYGKLGTRERTGREYLEKIVQIEFVLPPPRRGDMERLLRGETPSSEGALDEAAVAADLLDETVGVRFTPAMPLRILREEPATIVPTVVILGAVASVVFVPFGLSAHSPDIVTVGILFGAIAQIGTQTPFMCYEVITYWRRRQAERARERVKTAIDDLRGRVGQAGLEDAVVAAVKPADAEVAKTLVKAYLVDAAEELIGVETVILQYPPALPRAAKRMLNHARLLTQIARDRNMFGGEPRLLPGHLGQWIVLRERWPALARVIEREPSRLAEIERQAARSAAGAAFHLRVNGEDVSCTEPALLVEVVTTVPLSEMSRRDWCNSNIRKLRLTD